MTDEAKPVSLFDYLTRNGGIIGSHMLITEVLYEDGVEAHVAFSDKMGREYALRLLDAAYDAIDRQIPE